MKASRETTFVASALLLACMAGSVLLLRGIDRLRTGATLEEVLYISSPKALKRMSLGYDGLVADIYWTRAVQYFGGHHHGGAKNYTLLSPLLRITAELDPHLIVVYQYGGNFLAPTPPNGAGMPQAAIDLVEYGIQHNPDDWHLYYQLGFIYYMELNDYGHAAEAFARGANVPGSHPWLKLLAAQMAERSHNIQTARMMWATTLETTTDKAIKYNAASHLRALQVDEDVTGLEAAVVRYQQATGHLPRTFADMVSAGMLRGTPVDPLGNPYKLTPDGHVELKSPDDFPFVEKGLPPGYVPPEAPKVLPTD
jgi:tetratricopeptide (TPR) repeat protein